MTSGSMPFGLILVGAGVESVLESSSLSPYGSVRGTRGGGDGKSVRISVVVTVVLPSTRIGVTSPCVACGSS